MRFLLFCVLFAFLCIPCIADNGATNLDTGRYAIYMNPLARADQFLLDKKTGRVWQLVKNSDGISLWDEMQRWDLPQTERIKTYQTQANKGLYDDIDKSIKK